MITKFKIFENTDTNLINVKEYFDKYDYPEFIEKMRELLIGKKTHVYDRDNDWTTRYTNFNSVKVNNIREVDITEEHRKRSKEGYPMILFIINKNVNVINSDLILIEETPVIANEFDPYGEEEWGEDFKPNRYLYLNESAVFSRIEKIIKDTFILMANYQFPGMPCQGSWKWYQSKAGVPVNYATDQIPQDCSHPLAVVNNTGGWKMIMEDMPPEEQENSFQWDGITSRTVLLNPPQYSKEFRTRYIINWI